MGFLDTLRHIWYGWVLRLDHCDHTWMRFTIHAYPGSVVKKELADGTYYVKVAK